MGSGDRTGVGAQRLALGGARGRRGRQRESGYQHRRNRQQLQPSPPLPSRRGDRGAGHAVVSACKRRISQLELLPGDPRPQVRFGARPTLLRLMGGEPASCCAPRHRGPTTNFSPAGANTPARTRARAAQSAEMAGSHLRTPGMRRAFATQGASSIIAGTPAVLGSSCEALGIDRLLLAGLRPSACDSGIFEVGAVSVRFATYQLVLAVELDPFFTEHRQPRVLQDDTEPRHGEDEPQPRDP